MSQRGRSGFLSYLLLLSRLLQFEHRAQEVAAPLGPRGSRPWPEEGEWWGLWAEEAGGLPPPLTPSPSSRLTRAAGGASSAGQRRPCSACMVRRAIFRSCSWQCCEWAGRAMRGWDRECKWAGKRRGTAVSGRGAWGSLEDRARSGTRQPCCPGSGPGPHRHWQVSSRHHQTCTLDYGYLLGLLEDMEAHWEEAASLPQEQVGSAWCPENAVPGRCAVG